MIVDLKLVWDELSEFKPKNITPAEKKKFAQAVFEICGKHDKKTFTGLYFQLADEKVKSIEDYMMAYDDKVLYKLL